MPCGSLPLFSTCASSNSVFLYFFFRNPSCWVLLRNPKKEENIKLFKLLYPQVKNLDVRTDGFLDNSTLKDSNVFESKLWELLTLKK